MAESITLSINNIKSTIKLSDAGQSKLMACSGGFVEISANAVNIMSDTCEDAGEIDAGRAKAALARAKERLSGVESEADIDRAVLAKERAEARLKVLDLMER